LERCTAFKNLLEVHTYSGSPPHKQLPVAKEHFDRWMEIFTTTTDELFVGVLPKKQNYANMAEMNYKIDYFKCCSKRRSFKFEIKSMRKLLLLAFLPFSFLSCSAKNV
jgi:hypothetical protein